MSALAYYRSMPDSQPQRQVKKALAASQIVSMVRMRKPVDCTMTDTRPQCCDCGPGSGSGPTCKVGANHALRPCLALAPLARRSPTHRSPGRAAHVTLTRSPLTHLPFAQPLRTTKVAGLL